MVYFVGAGCGLSLIHICIFDEGTLAYDLCQCLAKRKGVCLENLDEKDYQSFKEKQYDLLADGIRKHMDMKRIYEMLQEAAI